MSRNKYEGPQSSAARPLDPASIDEPIDAWERRPKSAQPEIRKELDDLRERIGRLEAEIDAIATEAHTAVGTLPGADRIETAKDVVADKRSEIQRLTSRLQEIERMLAG
jgi:archaellum component FlaC